MKFHRKKNWLCFTRAELSSLMKGEFLRLLYDELSLQQTGLNEFASDKKKAMDFMGRISGKYAHDKDLHELFLAAFGLVDFYGSDCFLCFPMRPSFDVSKVAHIALEEFIKNREEDSLIDVAVSIDDGTRCFQLKRYRGVGTTKDIVEFLRSVLKKYGNDISDTNLLVILQPEGVAEIMANFKEVHDQIMGQGYNFSGHIILMHNENNKESIMTIVYPELAKSVRPRTSASSKI